MLSFLPLKAVVYIYLNPPILFLIPGLEEVVILLLEVNILDYDFYTLPILPF